jgi:hypothetical protein
MTNHISTPKLLDCLDTGRVGSAGLTGGVDICFEGEGDKAVTGGKMEGVGDECILWPSCCGGGGERFIGEMPFLLGGRLGVVSLGR